jgi:hypothetical protein
MYAAAASADVTAPCRICKKETGGAPVCPFCGLKQKAKSNIWSASACPAGSAANGGRPTDPALHFSIFSPSNAQDVRITQENAAFVTSGVTGFDRSPPLSSPWLSLCLLLRFCCAFVALSWRFRGAFVAL